MFFTLLLYAIFQILELFPLTTRSKFFIKNKNFIFAFLINKPLIKILLFCI
jgi:hypothetical protein